MFGHGQKSVCSPFNANVYARLCEVRENENHHSYKINVNDRST